MRPRVVLDTNVCLDVFLFVSERSAPLRELLVERRLQAVTRADCREEWHRVLRYPTLALDDARCAAMEAAYDNLMLDVARVSEAHPGMAEPPRHPGCASLTRATGGEACDAIAPRVPRCRDRDDQKFLELARDAGAVALFTRDAELLRLGRRTVRDGLFHILTPMQISPAALVRPQRVSSPP